MKWLKRAGILLVILFMAALVLTAVFISPITKYIIEKYSKPVTGRQITMKGLFLNFFTGTMTITDLNVYEQDDKQVFFYCHRISSNITVKKMLRGEWEINEMKFLHPEVIVYQYGNHFSYDDIVQHLAASDTSQTETPAASPVKFWIRNLEIDSGSIEHVNVPYKDTTQLINLHFQCPSFTWDNPELMMAADFSFGSGGEIACNLQLTIDSLDYAIELQAKNVDVKKYYKSLNSMMHIGGLDGFVNAGLKFRGNFNALDDLAVSGLISLDNISIRDTANTNFTSFRQFQLQIDTVNVKENRFDIHKILLDHPYFKFDLYINGNNVSRMLVTAGEPMPDSLAADDEELDYTNIFTLMGSYVKLLSRDYLISNYSADSIILRNGHFLYNDYTLEDRFSYDIEDAAFVSGKINSQHDSIIARSSATINHSGKLVAYMAATPDFNNFRLNFAVTGIKMSDMNPYSRFYVATPFLGGVIDYSTQTTVSNGMLKSTNTISAVELTAGKKISDHPLYNVPVRLAVSLLKDVHGNINLDIPVEGDLNDPDYKLGKVIWQVIENILVKAATAPFRLIANMFGADEESMKQIPFEYLQHDLQKDQFNKLEQVVAVLQAKPEMSVELKQVSDTLAEQEQLALLAAKKQYYATQIVRSAKDSLSATEIEQAEAISNKDSLFITYLNQQLGLTGDDLLSTQEKCIRFLGAGNVEQQLNKMMEERNKQVLNYLTVSKSIAAERIKVVNNHDYLMSSGMGQPVYIVNYYVEE